MEVKGSIFVRAKDIYRGFTSGPALTPTQHSIEFVTGEGGRNVNVTV
jgi:hypothetical protein